MQITVHKAQLTVGPDSEQRSTFWKGRCVGVVQKSWRCNLENT